MTTEINERDTFVEHGEVGVSLYQLECAIQTWSALQSRETSIAEAATTFNVRPELVREVVEANIWMSVTGHESDPTQQFIEHEGSDE
ncbi:MULTISPECIES: hypothetical protein [Kaistia]|uniref:Uncharacterized protein n=1 Tax=Kaistia nematophila TaxID=2994654 RepID=A0A9X3E6Q4_9HYPH|nr:hypothetical protein [Kaistia nematophila]MCX5570583.1 hypothetical protein [Kaistia nematophila]